MRVEFNVTAPSSEDDCKLLLVVTARAMEEMGLPFESVEEVIVATPETFGDIVARFDKSRKYTNSRGLVAAGKMFTHRPTDKRMTHSILLQHSVVDGVFKSPLVHGKNYHTWPAEDQRNLYVLYHELGHCLDHERRPEDKDDGTFRTETGDRAIDSTLASLCALNHSMLLSELAACAHSGFVFTEGIGALDCAMNDTFVQKQVNEVRRLTLESPTELDLIRHETSGLFWFILLQQAKHMGSRLGNPELPRLPPAQLWKIAAASETVASILEIADAAIEKAWAGYPNFNPEFRDTMSECFLRLGEHYGYRFEKNGRGGIWWDAWTQLRAALPLQLPL